MGLGRTSRKDCILMKLKIYGCRGSVPVYRKSNEHFGGNTSCIGLFSGDYSIVLDGGSGLVNLCRDSKDPNANTHGPQDILLSHLHMDHIIGLCAFGPAFDANKGVRIFTTSRDKRSLANQVFGMFKPPYWPLDLEEALYAECITVHEDTPFAASHPDKTTSFHISDGKKSLVYLLDNEMSIMDDDAYKNLASYCKNADMVVFDSAYSPDDYPKFKGWGHSTVLDGIKLRRDSDCKRMMFTHFAQKYTDEDIFGWKRYFEGAFDEDCYMFACDGLEVTL